MPRYNLITPEGTRDYLFEEAAAIQKTEQTIHHLFEARGFSRVITPAIEFLDVYNENGHSIPVEYMYKLTDYKGRLMVIRPDSTMPIARLCATRLRDAALPLRLYYSQSVYAQNRVLAGRRDEVKQSGVELIGAEGLRADLEMVSLAADVLSGCRLKPFRIEIGHIGIFNALADALHIDEVEREQIRLYIESKNYPALDDYLVRFGDSHEATVLHQLPRLFGTAQVFTQAQTLLAGTKAEETLAYLKKLYEQLCRMDCGSMVSVDLGIVNRTDYYTGIVFKGYIEGHGEEVLSGGRYDRLIKQNGAYVPAIGFAVNIDAVAHAINQKEPMERAHADVLIVATDEEALPHAFELLSRYNEWGKTAEFFCDNAEKARAYATLRGIPKIVFLKESQSEEVSAEEASE